MRLCQPICFAVALGAAALAWAGAGAPGTEGLKPSAQHGAEVYLRRCTLCHGDNGDGKGPLPVKLESYPLTSLMKDSELDSHQKLVNVIALGSGSSGVSEFMPPYGQELAWTDLESVALFVAMLRNDRPQAMKLVQNPSPTNVAQERLGEKIFSERCVLCHGTHAEGDGRMGKILKDPPPADLTASRRSVDYLEQIITKGGEAVGRSKHMPPWGDQLNDEDLDAVIQYLIRIRD